MQSLELSNFFKHILQLYVFIKFYIHTNIIHFVALFLTCIYVNVYIFVFCFLLVVWVLFSSYIAVHIRGQWALVRFLVFLIILGNKVYAYTAVYDVDFPLEKQI